MLHVGSRLGPYEILAPLHLGGREAYRAHDHAHHREVTLQVLRVDFGAAPERQRTFETEIRSATALSHPNILGIHDAGIDAHAAYIVSAPLAGDTLRARIDARAVSLRDAVQWSAQIRRALVAARRNGLRHGHLSVDSVALDDAGGAIVLGVGLASLVAPHRRGSDVRAWIGLTGTMVRAGWQSTGRRRRVVWMTAAAALAAAIGVAVMTIGAPGPPVTSISAPGEGNTPARAATEIPPAADPAAERPPSAPVPEPPVARDLAESIVGTPPERSAVAERGSAATAPVPTPKPTPAAESTSRAVPLTTPVRPLTPVVADGRDAASLMTEATVRATEFDLAGAHELARAAAGQGDAGAQVAALYVRGLLDAREAFRDGGPSELLTPIREAIAALGAVAKGRPGSAEIARLTLQAAAAAAQSERDEMSLYLETAIEMESLQRMAGLPGAPLVPAAEMAGDLWLQVHRYEDARRAYAEAAERAGSTLRTLSGLARTARRLNDTAAACASYRRLVDTWGGRPGLPVEIAEARAYLGGCAP